MGGCRSCRPEQGSHRPVAGHNAPEEETQHNQHQNCQNPRSAHQEKSTPAGALGRKGLLYLLLKSQGIRTVWKQEQNFLNRGQRILPVATGNGLLGMGQGLSSLTLLPSLPNPFR